MAEGEEVERPPVGTTTPLVTGVSPYDRSQSLLEFLGTIAPNTPISGDQLKAVLAQVGLESVPPRRAAIQEGVLGQQRLAAGSPQEVLTQFNDQITQLQAQLQQTSQAVARQGSYALGGQRQRQRGQLFGQAANQYQQLFGQASLGGQRSLLQLATSQTPITALGTGAKSISENPIGGQLLGELGQGIGQAQPLLERLLKGNGGINPAQGNLYNNLIKNEIVPSISFTGTTPPATLGQFQFGTPSVFNQLNALPSPQVFSYTPPPNVYGTYAIP